MFLCQLVECGQSAHREPRRKPKASRSRRKGPERGVAPAVPVWSEDTEVIAARGRTEGAGGDHGDAGEGAEGEAIVLACPDETSCAFRGVRSHIVAGEDRARSGLASQANGFDDG